MYKHLCVCVLLLILGILVRTQSFGGPRHGKAVVCYVATWAAYRKGDGSFSVNQLNPQLCTHLVYSFAGLNQETNGIKILDSWLDIEKESGAYNQMVALKNRYPHLKVTIAIGGWNEGSEKYSAMASKKQTRDTFIQSVLAFLDKYKFDGLDLDWEYPAKRGGQPHDKANYVTLVKELKEAFQDKGYILTAALGAGKNTMDVAYDLAKLSRYLDLIHMMCYDYHGTWDGFVGANAPLRGGSDEDALSVEYTIKYMLSHGVSPYKMVLGLPMYGRTFILSDPDTRQIEFGRTKVQNVGFKGRYTGENGFMGYNEICLELNNKTSSWERLWHKPSSTPYLRNGDKIISYDNARSIAIKVKLAMDYNLGGLMVWSIDTDDFKGHCTRDTDAFLDFVERHETMVDDPVLNEALKTLKLRDAHDHSDTAYVISGGKLHLRLPEPMHSNYPLMETINQAANLALEENRIVEEMDRITKENAIDHEEERKPSSAHTISADLFYITLYLTLRQLSKILRI
ncbi:probable chitinase 2 [Galleria mellonella]|uniref:Probable chitinase 2 n=1 Tax=Galleria mellonella TaxID=7137 RepID=A0A6J1WMC9_GALME|nr:probable chitinase 2 [Galleria mellonella]